MSCISFIKDAIQGLLGNKVLEIHLFLVFMYSFLEDSILRPAW